MFYICVTLLSCVVCMQELSRVSVEKERERSEKLLQDAVTQESERSEQRLKEQHERLTAALAEEQTKQEAKTQQALKEAQEQHQVENQRRRRNRWPRLLMGVIMHVCTHVLVSQSKNMIE